MALEIWTFLILGALLLPTVVVGFSLAPWVPARSKDLSRIFQLAKLQPGEIFYDLGCGNGKTVLHAAKNFQAKAIGIEFGILLFLICKVRQLFARNKNICFHFGNLFHHDISDANVVYVFGMPEALKKKLLHKFAKELPSGTRIISYVFALPEWIPEKVSKPTKKDTSIYLYIKK